MSTILEKEDIEDILKEATVSNEDSSPSYKILLGGKLYVTSKGKSVWKAKNHAASAMRNDLNWTVVQYTLDRIVESRGLTPHETKWGVYVDKDGNLIARSSIKEICNAYDNFLQYLKDNNLIEIVKIN